MKTSRGASLDRYYLLKLFGLGVFLHRIHHSDPKEVFHSHPWNGFSIIFGSYREEFSDEPGRLHHRRWFNLVRACRHHRTVVARPVWTLFFHGRKCNQWSVISNGKAIAAPWEGPQGFKSYTKALSR